MNYLYLLVDLGAIIVPLLFSFHPKIRLNKHWGALWPSILLSTLPFLAWDMCFTDMRIWGFTPKYLSGAYIYNLPIEEVLFFICIPYACMFTHYCFQIWKGNAFRLKNERIITYIFLTVSLACALIFYDRWYTLTAMGGLFCFLFYLAFIKKAAWLSLFYFSHLFLLIPFFIVNGILTGTGLDEPIVWYNDAENMGLRILTIPVEDIFYGMIMLLLNACLFEARLAKSAEPALETLTVRE